MPNRAAASATGSTVVASLRSDMVWSRLVVASARLVPVEATPQAEPADRLEAELAEARKPALVRLVETLRRR